MPAQPHHLVINPVFDSSVTSSPEKTEFESAVNAAISYIESKIVTPITVSISFGYGEVGGQSIPPASGAESISTEFGYSYAEFYNAIQAADKTSPIQIAAAASLPKTDPTGSPAGSQPIFISAAEAIAMGLSIGSLTGGLVGNVGLSVDTYAWSQSGTIGAGQSDAVSELEHEITEVLGRTDQAGADASYTPLDFFRYTAANGLSGDAPGSAAGHLDEPFVTGYSANAFSYFSYDGKHVTLQYDTPALVTSGADIADWNQATAGNDSFDGVGSPGAFYPLSTTDLAEMNVLGFEVAPPRDNFASHGVSNFLIENTARAVETGQVGGSGTSFKLVADLPTGWTLHGNGDVLYTGDAQFLMENAAGALDAVGFAGGVASYKLLADLQTSWAIRAVGDFLGTGGDQILFQEPSGGPLLVGNEVSGKESFTSLGSLATTWSFVGAGDFLGEGHDQFLIKDAAGAVLIGDFNAGKTTYTEIATLAAGSKVVEVGDFLSDTRSDVMIESSAGVVYAAEVSDHKLAFTKLGTLAAQWSFVGAGDYLGEGHDQFLIENTAGAVLLGDFTGGSLHFTLVGDFASQWTFHN